MSKRHAGDENDLLDKVAGILDVNRFIGCAPSQTRAFVEEAVRPVLEAYGTGDGSDEVGV